MRHQSKIQEKLSDTVSKVIHRGRLLKEGKTLHAYGVVDADTFIVVLARTGPHEVLECLCADPTLSLLDLCSDNLNMVDLFASESLRGCDCIASALERSRLLDETQRRARREQSIREITDKMRGATSIEQLVQVAVGESRRFHHPRGDACHEPDHPLFVQHWHL